MEKKPLFLLIAFLPFLSFCIGYLLVQWLHAPSVLSTPSLIGLTMPQAARLCQPHLALRVIQAVNDAQLPDGTVLRQMPVAGQKIKTHQIISVVISAQPAHDQAPDYVGKSLEECTAHAQQQNYTLQIYPIPSTTPKNTCLAQIPAPGKSFNTNTQAITLYMSAPEPDWWVIPQYVHKTIAQIQEYISTDLVTLHIIHTDTMPTQHTCHHCVVIDQRPLPGSIIKGNNKQTITLYVRPFDT